jgi:hypothetical protein
LERNCANPLGNLKELQYKGSKIQLLHCKHLSAINCNTQQSQVSIQYFPGDGDHIVVP